MSTSLGESSPAGQRGQVDESRQTNLAEALHDAHLPALLATIAHLTGDLRWLSEPYVSGRRASFARSAVSRDDLPQPLLDEVRGVAYDCISDYLRRGSPAPEVSPGFFVQLMSGCVSDTVPPEYAEMAMEEMGLASREVTWRHRPTDDRLAGFHVVVVGAGMSGLAVSIQLERMGLNYTVLEKNPDLGGTWFENSYPGCRVDVASHFYSYSFERRPDWPDFYSPYTELRRYFSNCATKYRVSDHIRFGHELEEATWSEKRQAWQLKARTAEHKTIDLEAHALISAVGQLNRPKLPDIEGLEDFEGPMFHSSAWRHDVDLRDKRIGVIGVGASAMQFAPEVAELAQRLVIFQRSPQWSFANPDYRRSVPAGKQWLMATVPLYAAWYRFYLLWSLCDGLWPQLQVDPEWDGGGLSINAANDRTRRFLTRYMKDQLGERQDLLPKTLPQYPPYTKRPIIDNGWFRMLKRPNVDLVTERLARVTPNGVVLGSGEFVELDVIACGTGFKAAEMLWPMRITGRNGTVLSEVWHGDDPRALLGIAVPEFPNFFCLYGPNTNLGHGGSIIFHSECQSRYITSCLRELLEVGATAMECRKDAFAEYNTRLDETIDKMIWSQVKERSWYKNSGGRVAVVSPWKLVDYWNMTKGVDPSHWAFTAD